MASVLIVGSGHGSWEVRGRQIGHAIGARVTSKPTASEWAAADVVILVKHAIASWGSAAKASRARIIWDVLDIWRQPEENATPIDELVRQIHAWRARIGVSCLIGATQAMAQDIGGLYLPHHSRPGLGTPPPVRDHLKVVAYEGAVKYLGAWHRALEDACQRRGITFLCGPTVNLRDADVIVALRDAKWDGALCRSWKSGVKYVNAIAAGRPVITQRCAAATEIRPACYIVEYPNEVAAALDWYGGDVERRRVTLTESSQKANDFTLETVARQYQAVIAAVRQEAA